MVDYFKQNLHVSDQQNLHFDNNKTWHLKSARFQLNITYEHRSDCLYVFSPVWNGLPKRDEVKLVLYEKLLRLNLFFTDLPGAGVGIDTHGDFVLIHIVMQLGNVPHTLLHDCTKLFMSQIDRCIQSVNQTISDPSRRSRKPSTKVVCVHVLYPPSAPAFVCLPTACPCVPEADISCSPVHVCTRSHVLVCCCWAHVVPKSTPVSEGSAGCVGSIVPPKFACHRFPPRPVYRTATPLRYNCMLPPPPAPQTLSTVPQPHTTPAGRIPPPPPPPLPPIPPNIQPYPPDECL